MSEPVIKIFIADRHPLVRKMLKEILERETDMKVIGDASSTHEVMNGIGQGKVDVLITGLSLRGSSVFSMLSDVKRHNPNVPILVLTMHPKERFAVLALKSGASKYLTKDVPPEEMVRAVRELVSGERRVSLSLV